LEVEMSRRLTVDGKSRIIRDVRQDDDEGFHGYYRGCEISISEYGYTKPGGRFRWNFDVRAPDGSYVVNTWEYADEVTREQMLETAVRNILL
jgi:hypothetical protein